eukprot:Colp12_sorted_trinity150504_noHs@10128
MSFTGIVTATLAPRALPSICVVPVRHRSFVNSRYRKLNNLKPGENPPYQLTNPLVYDDTVKKFINRMMYDGKKARSEEIIEGVLYKIKSTQHAKRLAGASDAIYKTPLEIFHEAIENVKPVMESITVKVGGAQIQVPSPISPLKRRSMAIKWIITAARDKSGRPMADRLYQEIMDAYNKTGGAYRKKLETHKVAEANRAYAHFRWQ